MVVLAILVAKLLSPLAIVIGLLSGWFARKWWQVLIGAAVAAVVDEAALHAMQQTRVLDLGAVLIGFVAAAIWGFAVFGIRQMRRSPS